MGSVWDDLGEPHKALAYYEQALRLRRAVSDRGGEAVTLNNIGRVYDALDDIDKSIECLERSVDLMKVVEHPRLEETKAFLETVRRRKVDGDSASSQ